MQGDIYDGDISTLRTTTTTSAAERSLEFNHGPPTSTAQHRMLTRGRNRTSGQSDHALQAAAVGLEVFRNSEMEILTAAPVYSPSSCVVSPTAVTTGYFYWLCCTPSWASHFVSRILHIRIAIVSKGCTTRRIIHVGAEGTASLG